MARGSLLTGDEPVASNIVATNDNYNAALMKALNWYSLEKLKSDARRYTRDYIKKKMPSELKKFDDVRDSDIVMTYGWIARLIMNDAQLADNHKEKFTKYITNILNTTAKNPAVVEKAVTQEPVVAKPSIQDAMKEKISEYIGELEGQLDDIIENKADFSLFKNMQAVQLPAPYVPSVKEWAKKKLREFIEVYEAKDSMLVEGYSNFGKRDLKAIVKTLAQFVEDCDKYSEFKKANRKPRVTRAKPAGVQVKNLKYMKQFDELKLTSVSPTEIIGAQQVWLYNTKQRKLIVYRTDSATGIQVKGSSLQNYDPELCCQKTLRKPEEQIKAMMSAGKVQLRKFMDTISSKPQSVSGRLNADCIILKTTK